MPEESKRLLGRWLSFFKEYPALACDLTALAQVILAMDRIEPRGVERTINSIEMQNLLEFLRNHPEACSMLGINDLNPIAVLKTLDVFATVLIFHHEEGMTH